MAEIRALRGQLERSIQVNNCLRLQLEQQLDGGRSKTSLSPSSTSQEDPGDKQGRKDKGTRKPIVSRAVTRMSLVKGPTYLFHTPWGQGEMGALGESMGFRITAGSKF